MADRNEKYRQKITESCQPHVGEPILAVGMYQPRGMVGGGLMTMGVSALAGGIMRRQAKDNAGGLPEIGVYALTATALHVFDVRPKGTGVKVKAHVASWPRGTFQVAQGAGKITDQLELTFPDGSAVGLEAMRMGSQGFNDAFAQALQAPM